ncbi:metal-dependent hydrolase [Candidatus Pacearchaeota archaeon]|nr:metal-dependent hydrolase [Candidatus Pacearchaeota archaeon]
MPYTLTHILAAIILIELFRAYVIKNNKKFPRYYILIAMIGAILPDFDIGLYYILSFFGFGFLDVHKTFSHSIFIPLILFIIGFLIINYNIKNSKLGKHHIKLFSIFFILGIGSLLHLILDGLFFPGIMPFYPFSNYYISFNILKTFPESIRNLILPTIDAVLIIIWIFWLEFKLKITDYF